MKLADAEFVKVTVEEGTEYGYWQQDAPEEAVDHILLQPTDTGDGRSRWVWIRLPDGDLILGVYPQGDTYFATEHLRSL